MTPKLLKPKKHKACGTESKVRRGKKVEFIGRKNTSEDGREVCVGYCKKLNAWFLSGTTAGVTKQIGFTNGAMERIIACYYQVKADLRRLSETHKGGKR